MKQGLFILWKIVLIYDISLNILAFAVMLTMLVQEAGLTLTGAQLSAIGGHWKEEDVGARADPHYAVSRMR